MEPWSIQFSKEELQSVEKKGARNPSSLAQSGARAGFTLPVFHFIVYRGTCSADLSRPQLDTGYFHSNTRPMGKETILLYFSSHPTTPAGLLSERPRAETFQLALVIAATTEYIVRCDCCFDIWFLISTQGAVSWHKAYFG